MLPALHFLLVAPSFLKRLPNLLRLISDDLASSIKDDMTFLVLSSFSLP